MAAYSSAFSILHCTDGACGSLAVANSGCLAPIALAHGKPEGPAVVAGRGRTRSFRAFGSGNGVFLGPFGTCILSLMSSTAMFRESRRSTRVPLKVAIAVEGGSETLTCEGNTVMVNLHGALLTTALGLTVGMSISIHVHMTDKRAKARVVYVDPQNPLRCGVELEQPRNIWGVPLPPDDWDETADPQTRR